MALSDLDVKQSYAANGVTTTFAITPTTISNAGTELAVYKRDESTTPATETLQTLTTHYTIVGSNVEFNVAPASGLIIVIKRVMPLTQTLALALGSAINQPALELALDRIVAMIQQLDEALSRAPLLAATEQVAAALVLPEPQAGMIIGWSADETNLEAYDPADLLSSSSAIQAHIVKTSAAHAASAISNTPAGNLVATDVQGALDELQTQLDGVAAGGGTVEANTAGSGAPNVLIGGETGAYLTNEGSGAENYHTLPAAAVNLQFTFYVQASVGMRIVAGAGDTIRVGSLESGLAGYIESLDVGSCVRLLAINATEWVAIASVGVWDVV